MAIFRTVAFHHHVTGKVRPLHPDDAAFVASAQPVLELYSAALPSLRLPIPRSCLTLWIGMDSYDLPRINEAGAPAEVEVGPLERVEGDNWARVRMPPGVADLTPRARALLALDVVAAAANEVATMAGWPPGALDAAWQNVVDHGFDPASKETEARPSVVLTHPDPYRILPGSGSMDAPDYTRLSQALHQVMAECRAPEWQAWWSAGRVGVLRMHYRIGGTGEQQFVVRLARGTLTAEWRCPSSFARRLDLDHAAVAHAAWTTLMAKVQARAGLGAHPPIAAITVNEAAIAQQEEHRVWTEAILAQIETGFSEQQR